MPWIQVDIPVPWEDIYEEAKPFIIYELLYISQTKQQWLAKFSNTWYESRPHSMSPEDYGPG